MTEQQEMLPKEIKLEHEKGKFVSPFKEYKGFVQFPYPFKGEHYKKWLRKSKEELPEQDEIEKMLHFVQVRSAIHLIEDSELEGCVELDPETCEDDLPLIIQVWLREALMVYLGEQFDLKNLLELSETS